MHALSTALFGESLLLRKFPRSRRLRGIGLSDALLLSGLLSKRFDYQNTCYDREPRFDITDRRVRFESTFDFVIASEVFEHVPPPVQRAFDNLASMLKPEGVAIFSTPWEVSGETIEHFPSLHDWSVAPLKSGHVLVNRTLDGRLEMFEDVVFHGGPGSTVEMRIFSKDGLLGNCAAAGLEVEMAEDYWPYGIVWEPWSRGMLLRRKPRAAAVSKLNPSPSCRQRCSS